MVIKTPDGISVVTLSDWSIALVPGPHLNLLFTGHISRNAYYATRARDDAGGPFQVWAVDVDTGKARRWPTWRADRSGRSMPMKRCCWANTRCPRPR
jgi:oligogalacturonide lyase